MSNFTLLTRLTFLLSVLISISSFSQTTIDSEDFEFPILKSQFGKLDTENYSVNIGSNRSILSSTDSKSISVIGILNENEYDSEKELDLN